MAKAKAKGGTPGWVVTFADMMTLLLCLFVLMLAASSTNTEKYKALAEHLHGSFGARWMLSLDSKAPYNGPPMFEEEKGTQGEQKEKPVEESEVPPDEAGTAKEPPQEEHPLDPLAMNTELADAKLTVADLAQIRAAETRDALSKVLKEEIEKGMLTLKMKKDRVVISLPDKAAFPAGSADLTEQSLEPLERIAKILAETKGVIRVSGHTDDTPISTAQFRSNWDLSSARAASVVQYLLNHANIEAKRIVAMGHADSQPVAPNDTEANRARNRRVEIQITMR